MSFFEFDQATRLLWKLPFWVPVTAALRTLGRPFVPPNRVPQVQPGGPPRPLDAFMRRCPEGFSAGAAVKDITPARPEGMHLAGFAFNRTCTGVRDPLFARALAMTDGRTPLVIVTLDLIGLSRPRTERIRALLTEKHPDSVLLVCTHNHQGPDTIGLWGRALFDLLPYSTGQDPVYMDRLEKGVIAAVEQALADICPARLHLAAGEFDRAGRWVHNERSPVIDRQLRVIHLTDEQGRAIATLAQHACHPETLWQDNRRISADFCSVCCSVIERSLGGVGLYVNGALGAMVSATVGHETPFAAREPLVEKIGTSLGQAAVRLARRALKDPVHKPRIRTARSEVCFPAEDNRLYGLVHALGVVEDRDLDRGLISEVGLARVGPASLTCIPGEAAPALGLELLERVPGSPKFLFGLCNDELGYLLPPEFFHDRAYAYEQTMTPGPLAALRLALAIEKLVEVQDGFEVG